MAGAEKVAGGGGARRPALLLLLCLAAAVLQCAAAAQQQTVMLVERPERLQVLNGYQQAATPEERARLRPWTPLTVLKQHDMLPDGFTAAMQVSAGGETFYLIKDPSGLLAGAGAAGRIITVFHAELLGDTARTSAPVRAELAAGGERTIPAGTLVERLVRAGKTYVRVLRGDGAYGWIPGNLSALLRPYHAAATPMTSPPAEVEAAVRVRLDETNTVLRKLFGLLNGRTGRSLAPPAWSVKPLPGALLCELSGTSRTEFTGSTRFLAKDIENALLGTGCHVETAPGLITVLLP